MKDFRNKVAVITGAGSGIGRALAIALAGDGARLALSDINDAGLAETMRQLPAKAEARAYRVDVSSQQAVFAHADEVKRDFGTAHVLFNNAGATLIGFLENQTIDEMRWVVDINLWGVVCGTKAFLPMMLAQREGCIVNVSSIFGLVGAPTQSAYCTAKFAVRGFTESLWVELRDTGVEAIVVHPGGTNSGFDVRARRAQGADDREDGILVRMAREMTDTPEKVAGEILAGVRKGRRRVLAGRLSRTMLLLPRLFPDSYHRFMKSITG